VEGTVTMAGRLTGKLIHAPKAPLMWRLRNTLTWRYLWGWAMSGLARWFSKVTGVLTITSELRAVLWHDGKPTDYGVISRRMITDAGVAFLVDDWTNDATDITTMNFHSCGIGVGVEAVGNIALVNESDPAITTRAAGVKSQPSAWILRTVGTNTFTGGGAIIEHGLFSQLAVGGTLWDRHVFLAYNVVNTDAIQWTYDLTINSGG